MLIMEKRLKALFDYQRFEKNSRLADIVEQTESRYKVELSDEELFLVNAAGEINTDKEKPLS